MVAGNPVLAQTQVIKCRPAIEYMPVATSNKGPITHPVLAKAKGSPKMPAHGDDCPAEVWLPPGPARGHEAETPGQSRCQAQRQAHFWMLCSDASCELSSFCDVYGDSDENISFRTQM